MCPGSPLARLLLREVLRQITAKTGHLTLTSDIDMTRWPEYGPLRAVFRVDPVAGG